MGFPFQLQGPFLPVACCIAILVHIILLVSILHRDRLVLLVHSPLLFTAKLLVRVHSLPSTYIRFVIVIVVGYLQLYTCKNQTVFLGYIVMQLSCGYNILYRYYYYYYYYCLKLYHRYHDHHPESQTTYYW
jgi:hypothetical protein